jgi:uncharacterized membrane protein YagU involved in acid resistance
VPAEVWNSIGTQKSVWYSFTFGIVADMFVLMAHLIFVVVLLFRYCLTASLLHSHWHISVSIGCLYCILNSLKCSAPRVFKMQK